MVERVTNEVGFSTYAFRKPKLSLAANGAHWQAELPMSFGDFQPLVRKAVPCAVLSDGHGFDADVSHDEAIFHSGFY